MDEIRLNSLRLLNDSIIVTMKLTNGKPKTRIVQVRIQPFASHSRLNGTIEIFDVHLGDFVHTAKIDANTTLKI